MIRLLTVLVLSGLSAQAQTITETFGSGANQFSIDFVQIGNPENIADTSNTNAPPVGSVSYVFNLGKYEMSRDMVLKASTAGGLGITLHDMSTYGGNGLNRPATGISWNEAARFVNWLNTSSGYSVAYKFDGGGNFQLWNSGENGFQATNPFRNSLARYFIPSSHEWYKGAYGSPDGSWYSYATGSNAAPSSVSGGTAANTSVYYSDSTQYPRGPADINNAGGLSPYGTMAQGGNVWELLEGVFDGATFRTDIAQARGASWYNGIEYLEKTIQSHFSVTTLGAEGESAGFRIAMVPEPSSLSLLLAGGAVLMAGRRRR